MQCPQCQAENPDQAKFCLECGAKLQAVCPQCGAALPPQAKFCFECGARIEAPAPTLPPAPTPAALPPTDAALAEALKRLIPKEFAERLLATRGKAGSERRMVTILFSDVRGSTSMAEKLDPEDVMEIMNGAFEVLIPPVYKHEGTLARLMGDAILAFFGAPLAHEDDPERAIRAALEIVAGAKEYAARLEQERSISGFNVRVGINTGLVVVGEVGSDLRVEYTAMGDAINLAARMEQSAPVGGILISRDTYLQVRGLFEVQALEPVTVKGKAEPVQVYVVQRAKPRAFHLATRGVEGIETRMIGREGELKRLQDAFLLAHEDGERQMVTVVGESGVGKTRLLYEFEGWVEQIPQPIRYFRGRAGPELQNVPYALLRDLFVLRFDIQDSDPARVVRDKLERGLGEWLGTDGQGQMKAHLIGQLLGFDFSASPHLQGVLDDAKQLRDRALIYLDDLFRAAAALATVVILLEDIQWADDSSLDVINHLAGTLGARDHAPFLFVCLARPTLHDRRLHWGEGQTFHARLELHPLSTMDSRRLVAEILQRVGEVPTSLRDAVVSGADGNPLYVEELIKVMIEEGVIVKSPAGDLYGDDGRGPWHVEQSRLADLRVPPTLTGVLQARLDSLPMDQRAILQQAAVVGRTFWDLVVVRIGQATGEGLGEEDVPVVLSALRSREMVDHKETSAFAGAQEFIFRHAALREVAYESILKKVRRGYHALVADWLMEQSRERTSEYTGLIAEHLEKAGRTDEALAYLWQAGDQAAAQYANGEAVRFFSRALDLLQTVEQEPVEACKQEYVLLSGREGAYKLLGNRQAQATDLERLTALAEGMDDVRCCGEVALRYAAYYDAVSDFPAAFGAAGRAIQCSEQAGDLPKKIDGMVAQARALWRQGTFDQAEQHLLEALALSQQHDYQRGMGNSLQSLGNVRFFKGDLQGARTYWEEALTLHRAQGQRRNEAMTLGNLVAACGSQRDLIPGRVYSEQALTIYQTIGDRRGEATALSNLAGISHQLGDLAATRHYYERSLALCQTTGDRQSESGALNNLALVLHDQGNYQAAQRYAEEALTIKRAIGDRRGEGYALNHLALALEGLGDVEAAAAAYEQALQLRREIGQLACAVDDEAGLARVALKQGRIDLAASHVEQALGGIAERGVEGIEYPVRVYLTAADLFQATGQPDRTREMLAAADRLVQERAEHIGDEAIRRGFLEGVPLHRQLYERLQA
ncbi:MAG: tetratricopeptide repeat protein [Anaerolineae bacterium]|nr:tetratricopeptide repeat protein [Anaerolineae bacterium]